MAQCLVLIRRPHVLATLLHLLQLRGATNNSNEQWMSVLTTAPKAEPSWLRSQRLVYPEERATQAGKLVGSVAKLCGGGGGGRPNLAQAGGRQPERIPEALEAARTTVVEALEALTLGGS